MAPSGPGPRYFRRQNVHPVLSAETGKTPESTRPRSGWDRRKNVNASNPYAPSAATLHIDPNVIPHTGNANVWRDGKVLVMRPDASLPPRCVKCNGPSAAPTKSRNVYWHHWGIYFVLLLNVIIYVIVALAARRKAIVAPGLCAQHKRKRRYFIAGAWLGVVVALLLFVGGAPMGDVGCWVMGGATLLLLASIVFGMIGGRVVWAKHISKEYARLKGCGPQFLDSLPRFPG